MNAPSLSLFCLYMRMDDDDGLEEVRQTALTAAQQEAEAYMGVTLASFDDDRTAITAAIFILAQLQIDEVEPPNAQAKRDRALSLLRPYRVDTGIAGGGI